MRTFFVALAEEGAALRQAVGPAPRIFVLSGLMAGDATLCAEHDLLPCLNSPAQVAVAAALGPGRCAVQLDSGMNRLGLEADELAAVAAPLGALAPVLVLSHLACGGDPDHPRNDAQRRELAALAAALPGVPWSLAATGGILLGPDFHGALTRPGIGLFGGAPFAAVRPVVRLALPVIQVRDVAPGERVGYGDAWTAARPSRIATVAAGYADGLLWRLGAGGARLHAGEVAVPIVGRVSMDLITADVTDLAVVPDELEILNDHQTIDDLADVAGTIGYEILTSLGPRYERVYKSAAAQPGPA